MGVHCAVILDTVRGISWTAPVFRVILAVWPLAGVLTVVREACLGLVMGELDCGLAAGWKGNRSPILLAGYSGIRSSSASTSHFWKASKGD